MHSRGERGRKGREHKFQNKAHRTFDPSNTPSALKIINYSIHVTVSYGFGLAFSFPLDILAQMLADVEGHGLHNFGMEHVINYLGHADTTSEQTSDTGGWLLPGQQLDAEQFL